MFFWLIETRSSFQSTKTETKKTFDYNESCERVETNADCKMHDEDKNGK